MRLTNDKELNRLIKKYKPSIIVLVCNTLVCLGPILWVYMNIWGINYGILYKNVSIAFIAVIVLTLYWTYFFYSMHDYRKQAKRIMEEYKKQSEGDGSKPIEH
jgi:uncharacterized RDD family membrane protein YckC